MPPRKKAVELPADCLPMCKSCAFYLRNVGEDFGQCRRFPPVMVTEGDLHSFDFPTVNEDDFCGEYRRKVN